MVVTLVIIVIVIVVLVGSVDLSADLACRQRCRMNVGVGSIGPECVYKRVEVTGHHILTRDRLNVVLGPRAGHCSTITIGAIIGTEWGVWSRRRRRRHRRIPAEEHQNAARHMVFAEMDVSLRHGTRFWRGAAHV